MHNLTLANEIVPIANCKRCKHYTPNVLFIMCNHSLSAYKENNETKYHTIQHMRTGKCGPSATFYAPKG